MSGSMVQLLRRFLNLDSLRQNGSEFSDLGCRAYCPNVEVSRLLSGLSAAIFQPHCWDSETEGLPPMFECTGTKFKVVYESIEDLQKGLATELPALTKALPHIPVPNEALLAFSETFGLLFDDGNFNFEQTAINNMFPWVQRLKIKDAIQAVTKTGHS